MLLLQSVPELSETAPAIFLWVPPERFLSLLIPSALIPGTACTLLHIRMENST